MKRKKTAALLCAGLLAVSSCAKQEEREPDTEPDGSEQGQVIPDETPDGTPDETPEVLPEKTAEEKAREYMAGMSLDDKLSQLVFMAFRTWNGQNLTALNEEVSHLLQKYHFGGICLFAENITADNAMAVTLSQDMQEAVTGSGGAPMFISTDQEGGTIWRIADGTATVGNMALAATGKSSSAADAAKIIGRELSALGINCDFAPVADVNANPSNPVIGVRSFSDDPSLTAQFVQQYVSGLHSSGVLSCLKHFPGHGDTDTDSHTGLPLIEKYESELFASDLIPFSRMIQNGYHDMIMTAHIQFPEIETGTYTSILDGSEIHLPATLSRTILTGILREKLGFKGIIITDSMIMDAIAAHFDPADAASLAVNAGADMLLMPVSVSGSASIADLDAWMARFRAMAENGTIPAERIDEAVVRILSRKYAQGVMDADYSPEHKKEMAGSVSEYVGTAVSHEKEILLADAAATVVENNGVLPVAASGDMTVILAGINGSQASALGYGFNRLVDQGYIPDETAGYVIDLNWTNNYAAAADKLPGADLLIVTDFMYSAALISPSYSDQLPALGRLIRQAHDYGVKVVAISAGLPYDLPLLAEADAVIAVFSQTGVNDCDDAFRPRGTYGANLAGAMDVIFSKVNPSGKLPVNIPSVSGGQFTADYMYERGYGLSW